MRKAPVILFAVVCLVFAVSWVLKSNVYAGEFEDNVIRGFMTTFAAFLTLAIFSFLYKDNPYYKFAEHLFVGVSAAYWMTLGFWSTLVKNLFPRISEGLSTFFKEPYQPGDYNFFFFIPVILGILLMMRLSPKCGWLSRWPLAFIVGTTAGLNFIRYLRSDFIQQISSTFVPLVVDWQGFGHLISTSDLSAAGPFVLMLTNWVIFVGVFSGLVYFFFSKEHTGVFGTTSRLGIWILMITFGASFGYTVMGRISLLVGRITFLFSDWTGLI